MRFTSLLVCMVLPIVSLVLTKGSVSHYGISLINEQLQFFEQMVVTCESFKVGSHFYKLMEKKNLGEEEKKRISLTEKCFTRVRERMSYFLKRYNTLTGNIFRILFPEGEIEYEPEVVNQFQREYIQHAMEVKHFFLHDMPNYYYELGKNMGVNFTAAEIHRDEKVLIEARKTGTQDIVNISRRMGVTEIPLIVHT